jgi:hypothetical protein
MVTASIRDFEGNVISITKFISLALPGLLVDHDSVTDMDGL